MVVLQQILTCQRNDKPFLPLPGNIAVQSRPRRYRRIGDTTHKICRGVPCEATGQCIMRAKLGGVDRTPSLRSTCGCCVLTGRVEMRVNLFESETRTKSPTVRHLPIREDFQSVCFSVH